MARPDEEDVLRDYLVGSEDPRRRGRCRVVDEAIDSRDSRVRVDSGKGSDEKWALLVKEHRLYVNIFLDGNQLA